MSCHVHVTGSPGRFYPIMADVIAKYILIGKGKTKVEREFMLQARVGGKLISYSLIEFGD